MKKLLSLLLAVGMLFSLSACGNRQTSVVGDNRNTTNAPKDDYDSRDTTNAPKNDYDNRDTTNAHKDGYDPGNLESMLIFLAATGKTGCTEIEIEAETLIGILGESYDSYDANKAEVTAFFQNTLIRSSDLYAAFQACSIDYFKCIAAQGLEDYDTWDDAIEDFYDEWDNAMSDYYDAWDDAYDDIYDLCDERIRDASDLLDYQDYSDAWSAMYEEYSDAWSAMYQAYSDAWSKIYGDYSACWSGFYEGNTDVDAILAAAGTEGSDHSEEETVQDIQDDASSDKIDSVNDTSPEAADDTTATEGINPEFKAAMDSYEKFFDEYIIFMKAYQESDNPAGMVKEYTAMMTQYLETMTALLEIDEETLSHEEALYYAEVMLRINQKLLEAA